MPSSFRFTIHAGLPPPYEKRSGLVVESEFAAQCDPDDPALAGRPESGRCLVSQAVDRGYQRRLDA